MEFPLNNNNNIEEAFKVLEEYGGHVLQQMGKGGFGSCYRVFCDKYRQNFVCKITTDVNSFKRELNIFKKADHQNIVRCYHYVATQKYYYLILEDCTNGTILDKLKKDPLKHHDFISYASQLVNAVSFLHANEIIHFDIKPSNVFIDKYNILKLGDFGLSEEIKPGTICTSFRGTQNYSAPEVVNRRPYDPYKADIFSLGVTLYVMMTAKHPFPIYADYKEYLYTGEVKLSQSYPADITNMIARCLSLSPTDRPSIQEIEAFFNKLNMTYGKTLLRANKTGSKSTPRIICPLVAHHKSIPHTISMLTINKSSNLKNTSL